MRKNSASNMCLEKRTKKKLKMMCASRESNPGQYRGRVL